MGEKKARENNFFFPPRKKKEVAERTQSVGGEKHAEKKPRVFLLLGKFFSFYFGICGGETAALATY